MLLIILSLLWPTLGIAQIYEYKNNHHDQIFSDRFPNSLTNPAKMIHPASPNNSVATPLHEDPQKQPDPKAFIINPSNRDNHTGKRSDSNQPIS